jgi:hypothetical protein
LVPSVQATYILGEIMNKICLTLFIALSLFNTIASASDSSEQNFLTTTIEGEKRIINLILVLDDSFDITAIKMDDVRNNKVFETSLFSTTNVEQGIIIFSAKGRDILKLLSNNFTPAYGGLIVMDFLYNGVTKTRRSIDFDLNRVGDEWSILQNGKKVKGFHIIKNRKRFIGEVGIRNIITKF